MDALIELDRRGAKGRLGEVLESSRLPARDAALAREICFGVQRRKRLIDFVLATLVNRELPRDIDLLTILRLGAYQLMFMDRIPPHAAVHASVSLAGGRRGFVNAVLRGLTRRLLPRSADRALPERELALPGERCLVMEGARLPNPDADPIEYHALLQSLPPFLVARWAQQHGTKAAGEIAAACSCVPAVFLRRSSRCESMASLAEALRNEGVETEASQHSEILHWSAGTSPFLTSAYRDGWFIVQDPTALRAVQALGARPGERVLDLCAAPGTKTSYLADAVTSSGKVFAFDPVAKRRRMIDENATRLGLTQIECLDSLQGIGMVDRVLVDVPCSNTGVLARRVEARDRVTEEGIALLARQQMRILAEGWEHLQPAGTCVYSTCSIEKEENEGVVEAFAAQHDVTIVEMTTTLPAVPLHDGGFYAVLSRPR